MIYIPKAQDIYRHFKGNIYQIVTIAEHTETEEKLVIYQAMYGDFKIYARPLSMFLEKVDKQKYPDVTQEYRFERIENPLPAVEGQILPTEQTTPECKTKQEAITVERDITEAEPELDPLLLEFLDADTYTQKLDILSALHHRITDSMITTMAIAGDIEVADGDLETRYSELKNCLRTLERYEIERVR